MKILVFNAGSSSQKTRLYEIGNSLPEEPPAPLWSAHADWTKEKSAAELKVTTAAGQTLEEELPSDSRRTVVEHMLKTLWSGQTQVIESPAEISMVGHRVVHGGSRYHASTLITPEVKAAIQEFSAFAPLHNPANLEGIEVAESLISAYQSRSDPAAPGETVQERREPRETNSAADKIPQVAVFDTAFHSQLPLRTAVYPGPYAWFEEGIRRYGFHGISHQYCAQRSAHILGRDLASLRMINCHLGNGCSLDAIQNGRSIETTMGFTPLEGLMMGSRSGTIDPSILLYLQREKGYTPEQLDTLLNKDSGLKGISGVSSDMRQLTQAIQEGNERARLALEMYIYRLRYFIGAMLAALGGLDVLTFTGGIGENAAEVRAGACAAFGFLQLKLDAEKNAASPADQDIAAADSAVRVLIVHTEEDWEIAKECWRIAHAHGYI
ncbi:acetate/propionate family kinase [Ktedonosporobacter rubrisoli]|uniref:acetate/propionate family kinase n=1 Tax=Ktedonosporobacter rubrisoli TaxID=2509675 RepID=UPI003BF4C8A4